MMTAKGYFTLGFFLVLSLPTFSQTNKFAAFDRLNNTPLYLASGKSIKPILKTLPNRQSKTLNLPVTDCGTGGQGGEQTNPNGNPSVSPDSKVNNPSYAVDGDPSTYSELHIDVQQKDVEVVQVISFSSTTYASDIVKLTLSLGQTLFNYQVTAQAYNGNTPVGSVQDITSSLTLYPSTTVYTFSPGVIFNQVRIGVVALQNGNHVASINLHDIYLTPAPPTPTGGNSGGVTSSISACQGSVVLSVSNPISGFEYRWYNSSNTLLQSSTSTTYSPANLSAGSYVYYVAAARPGCTVESAKDQINLTVKPKPSSPTLATN